MKRLILSDTHLTTEFEQQKFEFLAKHINRADQVIIVGDFWDGFFITFDEFINSRWQKLFSLLKKKSTVYLPGNHDLQKWIDDRCYLFCDQCLSEYQFRVGRTKYYCMHGHKIIRHIDGWLPFVKNRYYATISKIFYTLGTWIYKEKFWARVAKQNKKLIQYQHANFPRKVLITGHTHLQQHQPNSYINPGVNNYGLLQCAWVDGNKVTLIQARS